MSSYRPADLVTTTVGFPDGELEANSSVVTVLRGAGGAGTLGVVTAHTPFHPMDPAWPDQPGDTGALLLDGRALPVLDCLTATAGPEEIAVGEQVTAKRGDPRHGWLVVHVIAHHDEPPSPGDEVALHVDPQRRKQLSAAHTGCHLAALALNETLRPRWRKEVPTDSLGNPDFDSLAMSSSHISPQGSTDIYRLGKSLRKKGFTVEALDEDCQRLAHEVNERLRQWHDTAAPVGIRAEGQYLTDRRYWTCQLPAGPAEIPCGGTHPHSLAALSAITVDLDADEQESQLRMRTSVRIA